MVAMKSSRSMGHGNMLKLLLVLTAVVLLIGYTFLNFDQTDRQILTASLGNPTFDLCVPAQFRRPSESTCHGGGTNYPSATMVPKVSREAASKLTSGGFESIARGSADVTLVGLMAMQLSSFQHSMGVFGSVGELGVHHGRFTSTLFVTARDTEKLIVADVFEQQEKNIDHSGKGDKEKFMAGLQTYGLSENDLHHVHIGSTEEIPFDWSIQKGFEQFRLVSVDAGHTAALTFNDLHLAFCNTLKGGIVVIDDLFHNHWPGVTEGLFQFFASMGSHKNVYPFLACENKLFMTNDHSFYLKYYNGLIGSNKTSGFLATNTARWGASTQFTLNGSPLLICHREAGLDVLAVWTSLVY